MKNAMLFTLLAMLGGWAALAADNSGPKNAPMKPALLVVDLQNAFLPGMDRDGMDGALETINRLIDLFHQRGRPVIRLYQTHPVHGPRPGTEPFAYPASVRVRPEDPMVVRTYIDGFNQSKLDEILRAKKCNTVFLCGLSAIGCAFATYIGADNRDYRAFFVKGALLSHDATLTRGIEETFAAIDFSAVQAKLDEAGSHTCGRGSKKSPAPPSTISR